MIENANAGGDLPLGEPTAIAPAPAKEGAVSVADAARSLMDWRRKQSAEQRSDVRDQRSEEAARDAASDSSPESASANATADAAPATEQAPGETESAERADDPSRRAARAPQDDESPIEPPRSWTTDEKE